MLTVEQIRGKLGKKSADDDVGALLGKHEPIVDGDAEEVHRLLLGAFTHAKDSKESAEQDELDYLETAEALGEDEVGHLAALISVSERKIWRMYFDAVREGRAARKAEASEAVPAEPSQTRRGRARKVAEPATEPRVA